MSHFLSSHEKTRDDTYFTQGCCLIELKMLILFLKVVPIGHFGV